MFSIIVLNYNRLELTQQTVENLISKTTVPHEFIFVDNNSTDASGVRQYLLSLENKTNAKRVRYVFNKSNLGVAGGRNTGLRIAAGDYLMTIDDDVLVPDDYDKCLIEVCDNVPDLGITGVCVEKPKRTGIQNINGIDVRVKMGNLGGACLCMPRRVFNQVGYFRADFVYGIEDVDMYLRLNILRLKGVYIMPLGKHIDKRENISYEKLKRFTHKKHSKPFRKIGANATAYKKTKEVYIPYKSPNIYTAKFDAAIKKEEK